MNGSEPCRELAVFGFSFLWYVVRQCYSHATEHPHQRVHRTQLVLRVRFVSNGIMGFYHHWILANNYYLRRSPLNPDTNVLLVLIVHVKLKGKAKVVILNRNS